jgi:hypothetical protein
MSMTSDLIAPSRDDAITGQKGPRRRGAWRFLAKTSVLALILSVGWIAGVKTQERGYLDHLASVASKGSPIEEAEKREKFS